MKSKLTIAAIAGLLAATPAIAADGKRIATEKEFRELVVDRQLEGDRVSIRNTGDGKFTGMARGKQLDGIWNWVGDTYCRTGTWGAKNLGYDCQAVFVDGTRVTFVRNEGRGRETKLQIAP